MTFPKALDAVTVAREVPLDRLLLETDAPFLAPVPHRGRRNEPARVALVAARVALLRGLTTAAVATACAENTIRLFRLPLKVGADAVI